MRRRTFIALLGTAGLAPGLARGQQPDRVRRVGVLLGVRNDAVGQAKLEAFRRALQEAGWIDGQNVRVEPRWGEGNLDRIRAFAAELLSLKPDVIFTAGNRALNEQRQQTQTVPIVFLATIDPIGQGYAANYARPGGNTTGFLLYEFSLICKLLEVLNEAVRRTSSVGLLISSENRSFDFHVKAFEAAARALSFAPVVISVREPADLKAGITAFSGEPNGGLVVPPDVFLLAHREKIAALAVRDRMPLISAQRDFVTAGGLMSYGVDEKELYRQ